MVITIHTTPESANKKHAGQHWSKRKEQAETERMLAKAAALEVCTETYTMPVHIIATVYYPDKRLRDIDNADLKSFIDGFVDAGLLVDDNYKYVKAVTKIWAYDKENPRIKFVINEVAE